MAIEVKATGLASEKHLGNLKMLAEEIHFKHQIIVSMYLQPRKIGNIRILPLTHFLEALWAGDF